MKKNKKTEQKVEQSDASKKVKEPKDVEKKVSKKEKVVKKSSDKDLSQQFENRISVLEKELDDQKENTKKEKDNALLHMAELENFKRRKNQEVDSFKKYAAQNVVEQFLPVIDNFGFAYEHAVQLKKEEEDVVKGFILIQKQLEATLQKLNIKEINAIDNPFDPNFHQAIGQEKKEGVKSGIVIKVMQKGYMIHDKVIRPSMVFVSE
ncbi:nucleotide exchange factor GrpE [Candidatus Marinamargulisbacteria bacterium SCGC AG-343-D04]|nr:nucleotide exchange factor GrpE [Candidatus Marinamargulisbacteria bacterium SCGC AG-343-D04]